MKIRVPNDAEYAIRKHVYFLNDRIHGTEKTMTVKQLIDRIDNLYPKGTVSTQSNVDLNGIIKAYARQALKTATPQDIYKYYINVIAR